VRSGLNVVAGTNIASAMATSQYIVKQQCGGALLLLNVLRKETVADKDRSAYKALLITVHTNCLLYQVRHCFALAFMATTTAPTVSTCAHKSTITLAARNMLS
jgi:hypothetical protein